MASRLHLVTFITMVLLTLPAAVMAKTALIGTPLGDIEIELLENDAPNTVANFLNYVNNNRYDKAFIHRSVSGFIIQGGGFTFVDGGALSVEAFPTVDNEFKISNTRGTVAMAKLGDQPDSASSQWFINIGDNSANLDGQNGGFTVFARVIGNGMEVVDAISQLPRINAGGPFTELPVINFSGGSLAEANMVMTEISVQTQTQPVPFVMNAGLNDAWFNPLTDGQGFFITIFPELGVVTLAWFTYDTELPAVDATANLGDAGHRWLTATGTIEGDTSVMNIDITSGGLFDTSTVIQHTDPSGSDGTVTLTFENCNSGLIEYDILSTGQQGSIPIQRIAGDNIALCEALTDE